MTVEFNPAKIFYDGNGATVDFTFEFKYLDNSQIEVYVNDALVDSDDYTITAAPSAVAGGTITFDTAPASGTDNVLIQRVVEYTQPDPVPTVDKLGRGLLETMFDRVTLQVQQLAEITDRCLKIAFDQNVTPDTEITLTANKAVIVNADGDGFTLSADDYEDQATAAAASALAASGSATAASGSASAASASATAASGSAIAAAASAVAADASADAAEAAVAAVDLPASLVGNALGMLRVNAGETAYEHRTPAQVLADIDGLTASLETLTSATVATGDIIAFGDISDSNNIKRTTVADVLALATSTSTLEYLGTSGAISAAAQVDFTTAAWFSSTYIKLVFELIDVLPATDAVSLRVRTSVSGTFLTTNEYDYINNGRNSADTAKTNSAAAQAQIIPHTSDTIGNASNEGISGSIALRRPTSANWKWLEWQTQHMNASTVLQQQAGSGVVRTTSSLDGVRFVMSSGNIASGLINVYGVRAS